MRGDRGLQSDDESLRISPCRLMAVGPDPTEPPSAHLGFRSSGARVLKTCTVPPAEVGAIAISDWSSFRRILEGAGGLTYAFEHQPASVPVRLKRHENRTGRACVRASCRELLKLGKVTRLCHCSIVIAPCVRWDSAGPATSVRRRSSRLRRDLEALERYGVFRGS